MPPDVENVDKQVIVTKSMHTNFMASIGARSDNRTLAACMPDESGTPFTTWWNKTYETKRLAAWKQVMRNSGVDDAVIDDVSGKDEVQEVFSNLLGKDFSTLA
eukprot:1078840-Karenia_brevis.AAC.1